MRKLHLVGFTTDHRGLIFSVRRGAKSGGFVIDLDEPLMNAVDELRAVMAEEHAVAATEPEAPRRESALSVREVQARLRRGRTVQQVAREAGVDVEWVMRFAAPVLAEQFEVVRAAKATRMTKQRVGLSAAPLGDCVYRNLADRGVTDPRDQLDRAWWAQQLTEGVWAVGFNYTVRGREVEAEWEFDEANGTLRSRGRAGTTLGYREPARRSRQGTPAKAGAPTKKTSQATTARQSSSRQASKRVAAARRAAAARMVSEAEKATRRDIAAVRAAARKPIVIPPRLVDPPAPLLPDEPADEPAGWRRDLELRWEDTRRTRQPEPEPAADVAPQPEPAPEGEPDPVDAVEEPTDGDLDDLEDDEETEVEEYVDEEIELDDEIEVDEEIEVDDEPAPAPTTTRRREPLRAPSRRLSNAEQARSQVRVTVSTTEESASNGPVFNSDLTRQAARGGTPAPPLPPPLDPIEPPPRRRRLRPLRGR